MFKQVTTTSLVVLAIISKASSSKFSLTLSTEQLGGDSTDYSEAKPLVVHVDKNSMSPEILEHLAHTSNIVFADLPELPQFINLREYESMKYATDDLLDQLINEQNLNLNSVKQNEKFSQIESILKEIITEDSKDDKKETIYEGKGENPEKKEMDIKIEEPKHVEYPDKDIFWGTDVSLISTKETEKKSDPGRSTYSTSEHSSDKHEKTSTFKTKSTSTSEEKHTTKSGSTSEHKHNTITSTSEHKNKTSSSISTKKSRTRTSKVYSTSLLRAPNNVSNITVSVGYDNSSSFVMPTSLVLAFLLTVLLFVHEY